MMLLRISIFPQKKALWFEYPHFMISHELVFLGIIFTEDNLMNKNAYLILLCIFSINPHCPLLQFTIL